MKYEDDIHNCTNERLAEMLERIGFHVVAIDYDLHDAAVIREAAARLRTKHKEHFNSEAFE